MSLSSLPASFFNYTPNQGNDGTDGDQSWQNAGWSMNLDRNDPVYGQYQSKFNTVIDNNDGSLTAWFQNPSQNKYGMLANTYRLNPQTNTYDLVNSNPFQQKSGMQKAAPVVTAAALTGLALGIPSLASMFSSGVAGGSGLTVPGATAGLGGTGAGLSTTSAMAGAITPSLGQVAGTSLLGTAGKGALLNAGATALGGGDFKDVLRAGITGGVTGAAGSYLSSLGGNMLNSFSNNPIFSSISKAIGAFNKMGGGQFGNIAEGLAGIYQGRQQRQMAKEFMSGYGTNRGAYEEQLRNNLIRRDAAAGRRSDYAGREVALQAALAELDSRNAPAMWQAQQARLGGTTSILQSLLRLGGKTGMFGSRPSAGNFSMPSLASLSNLPQTTLNPYDLSQGRRNLFGGG